MGAPRTGLMRLIGMQPGRDDGKPGQQKELDRSIGGQACGHAPGAVLSCRSQSQPCPARDMLMITPEKSIAAFSLANSS